MVGDLEKKFNVLIVTVVCMIYILALNEFFLPRYQSKYERPIIISYAEGVGLELATSLWNMDIHVLQHLGA